MTHLDKDNSGFVTRKEWIEYLCMNQENLQKSAFRANLKVLFNEFDSDNSGYLTKKELMELLK